MPKVRSLGAISITLCTLGNTYISNAVSKGKTLWPLQKRICDNYDNWFVAINDNHDKPFFIFMNIVISG